MDNFQVHSFLRTPTCATLITRRQKGFPSPIASATLLPLYDKEPVRASRFWAPRTAMHQDRPERSSPG